MSWGKFSILTEDLMEKTHQLSMSVMIKGIIHVESMELGVRIIVRTTSIFLLRGHPDMYGLMHGLVALEVLCYERCDRCGTASG